MDQLWNIRFPDGSQQALSTGKSRHYFFQRMIDSVSEPAAIYETAFKYEDTKDFFDFLGFTQQDISEVMEVDPSTLFRWRKENRQLTKAITKNILEMDQVVAKGVRIFGSEPLFSEWLSTTNVSLGDRRPIDLLKTPYGVDQIDGALEGMSWGAFQ
ncbi:MAG: toxin-antitoxin system TIGR02293 family antidote component [Algoriphagus marincola HL-49]|uniref:Toxin-antitoxin system TIGR02293 family antidote component n=1 Tax=Algoriphagus marincola HL-49 TaxID=1305737 RepID=A0A0P7XI46_9BACT|nr:MAG: toxin-antitoxin system TIGR02293 family antidote component [Algoriphagus marincola HL-49]